MDLRAVGLDVIGPRDNPAMDSLPPQKYDTLAAIDMGSNSFRLEIGQPQQAGRYKRVDYIKETVRLGAGLDDDSMLTEPAMQRGLDCLKRFAQLINGMPTGAVRIVGTNALREARNRN